MADSQLALDPTLAPPPAAPSDRLAPGTAAGDYVIDGFLGAGAMGEVYGGRHPVIGKRVAIKVLKRELSGTAEGAERFVREARAANQVNHPNVIDVFGFGRIPDGRLYLAMDLVEGRSLRKVVEAGPLEAPRALEILAQIAAALDAAHARGVVHRDLKPDNVMIGEDGHVFVLDFGLAKLVESGGGTAPGTLTGQGAWLGTPGYMAPEQWSADGAGPASDRYALGVMAFELLSGKLPFQATSLPQMMEQHFRAKVPALTARGAAAAHASLDPVLSRAMAKAPGERYATAAELVEALRAAAGGRGDRSISARGARRPYLPAAAGAGVLGLAVAAVFVARGGRDGDGGGGGGSGERAPVIEPRPEPAPGFGRVEVVTRPAGAAVWRGDRLMGPTPARLEVRLGEAVELELRKPGYATVRRAVVAAGPSTSVAVDLAPQNGFEGVWALPDGQLRAFRRAGEMVDVFKLKTVAGARELYRRLALEEPATPTDDVVFAGAEVLPDARAAQDPSCQIPYRVEYRYDPKRDALDVRPERVRIGFVDGRCVVREKLPGEPLALVRADRDAADDGRWSDAPVGKPRPIVKQPPRKKAIPANLDEPAPADPKAEAARKLEEARKLEAARKLEEARDTGNAGNAGKAAPPPQAPPPQAQSK